MVNLKLTKKELVMAMYALDEFTEYENDSDANNAYNKISEKVSRLK